MSMTEPAIEISGLWFSYGAQTVLRSVNLLIARGEFVCMLGPNGGGKTTLLRLMLGLLKPDRGSVRVLGGQPLETCARMGYVAQQSQFDPSFPVSVLDVVLMGRLGRGGGIGWHRRADVRYADAALAEVRMSDLRKRPFSELSGGQRQRVLIARALAAEPELLLLDEPTSNLDVGVEQEFQDLLAGMARRMTIVLVSHDIGFVTEQVGKVICVQQTVAVHPTASLTGDVMRDLYGQDIRLVRHDHSCVHQVQPREGQ
jgi:zinc transport system ATP-binding protein